MPSLGSTLNTRDKRNSFSPDLKAFNNPTPSPKAAPSMNDSLAQGDFVMDEKFLVGSSVYSKRMTYSA